MGVLFRSTKSTLTSIAPTEPDGFNARRVVNEQRGKRAWKAARNSLKNKEESGAIVIVELSLGQEALDCAADNSASICASTPPLVTTSDAYFLGGSIALLVTPMGGFRASKTLRFSANMATESPANLRRFRLLNNTVGVFRVSTDELARS